MMYEQQRLELRLACPFRPDGCVSRQVVHAGVRNASMGWSS
jgi:hypothetical protein